MSSSSRVIRYLAECYRENGSRAGITSLDSSRVRQSLFLEGEDPVVSTAILDGVVFVPGARAAKLATQAQLYEKERELYFGSLFFVGTIEKGNGRSRTVHAPLLLYSVEVSSVTKGAGAEFTIDSSRSTLNYALLEAVGDDDFIDRVEAAVSSGSHTEGCIGDLRALFGKEFPESDTDGLLSFPHLLSSRDLGTVVTRAKKGSRWSLQSAAVLFLADKSGGMRGVLNDLETMGAPDGELSSAAAALLEAKNAKWPPRRDGLVPATLSPAQNKVLESVRNNPLTLAIGPPGTGKSFTIAALAIEAESSHQSVLICSRKDHAVDVVADKIEESLALPGICIRAGRKHYLKSLKEFIAELLSGLHQTAGAQEQSPLIHLSKQRQLLRKLQERYTVRSKRAVRDGRILATPEPGIFTKWRQSWIRHRVEKVPLLCESAGMISRLAQEIVAQTIGAMVDARGYELALAAKRYRETLLHFSKSIRARSPETRERYLSKVDWEALVRAFPIWLVNLSDLHRILPMQREMFDLVIIDEASQCDIASALPALQRAKRVVITGDPKQLRHISFLPIARQAELARQFGLTGEEEDRYHFRDVSLVDLATEQVGSQDSVVFLNEHFRSRPDIIEFSNAEFYASQLAIMTGHREIDRSTDDGVTIHRCKGTREDNGINFAEIDAIFSQIDEILALEGEPVSIGILSPFRAQVDAIMKRVETHPAVHRLLTHHDILVGTAHSFQGEERDIMLLSFALDDGSPGASFRFLDKEDVFNVAVTRARIENRVFISFTSAGRQSRLATRYIGYAEERMRGPNRVRSSTQPCLISLVRHLEDAGIEVEESFRLGNIEIDLLCHHGTGTVAIDLVGFPGTSGEALTVDEQLMLARAGIEVVPLTYGEWLGRSDEALASIKSELGFPAAE